MKKLYLTLSLLLSINCFSQAIKVDTNTYTVPELVTNILVNKSCVPVTNVSWRTGTNFGSTNGIGYFDCTNPNFPLKSGVILSTGNVTNASGPNTTQLNDGNAAWTGDSDLEATLLAAGITMKSANATVLEFDFIPFSTNFDFKFLFASEEYGNFQCQFSDAFAFLLTNKSTGVTTNLAVVPNTTDPISVVTIRNSLYNSSCSSENSDYFGTFNGGSNAAGSATNYNGQTVLMNASSSTLTPYSPYHIKLVIADRGDYQADSAIFLGADSFNVGQDVLGPDLTVANNTALCDNSTHTLTSGLDPAIYSFAWTFNGNSTGGNTPNLTVDKAGIYGLTYTIILSNCNVTTDYITVEYNEAIITPDPINLYKCNSGQAISTFNLDLNTPIVSIPGTQISYYKNLADATSNSNPILSNYSIANSSLPATIWMRILNTASNCAIEKSFQLGLMPPPIAYKAGDITSCENSAGSNSANFDIAFQTTTILGGQSPSLYTVTYYTNAADANTGKNPLDTSATYLSGNGTIFVRVQSVTDSSCYVTTSFKLIVRPRPVLDIITDQFVCSSYTLPILKNPGNYYTGPSKGLPMLNAGDIITKDNTIYIYQESSNDSNCYSESSFNVKIVLPADIKPNDVNACDQYVLPSMIPGTRYFTLPGGPNGGGTEIFSGTIITNPGVNTIYTYFVSSDIIPCKIQNQFNVTINVTPIIKPIPNIFECSSYNLPKLAIGNYYTLNAGIYTPVVSKTITSTTTLYVFATTNSCRTPDTIFTVYIGTIGLVDVTQCLPYDLPQAPIGEYRDAPNGGGNIILPGTITKTTRVYFYVPGLAKPNCTDNFFATITIHAPVLATPNDVISCIKFLLPTSADGGEYYTLPGGPNTPGNVKLIPNVDEITTTSTIYIYKPSATVAGCYIEKSWLITIDQKPIIDSRSDIEQCNSYVLTPLSNGNYFDDPNGVNPLAAGTVISSNNRIYIFAANPNDPSCYSENSFSILINGVKTDPVPTQLIYCDSFTFPTLPTPNNNYYDAPGGPYGGGNLIPFGTTVTSKTVLPIYYIYYETGNRLNCSDESSFKLTIVPQAQAYPVNALETCDTSGLNDGIFQFNLTTSSIRNQVLNGQTPDTDFSLSFYTSFADANDNKANPIANPAAYKNQTPFHDSVWIRVTNKNLTNSCFAIVELKLIVNPIPDPKLDPEYYICEDYLTGTLLNPVTLNTGVLGVNYQFEWTLDGQPYNAGSSSIGTTKTGDYVVKVTNTQTMCSNTVATRVIKYSPHLEITYSDAFDNSTFISVSVLGAGSGNYSYQIDNSVFQDSPIFYNVSPGEHTISAIDKDARCNPAPINAEIINYPKFFTPNGDGYNETWNIPHLLLTNPDAPIFIFDKYGKLIKEITPATEGWDGMYNGQPLPSTDYWFTVDYSEKGTLKTFKAHFSLKR